MIRKRRIFAAVALGLILGIFSRTVHDIYFDYRFSEGLIAASGRPIGGDFVCFYLAGQAASKSPEDLYDWEIGIKHQRVLLNAPDGKEWILPYAYPPLLALLFIPFGKVDFFSANLAWIGFSLFLAFSSILLVLSQSQFDRRQKTIAALFILAFTPFTLDCLGGGQTSAIGMLVFAGVYFLTKKGREFAAGLMLGLGYYKPPLFFFFAISFLLQRRWRLVGGALLSGTVLISLSVYYLGLDGFIAYLEKMSRYVYGRELLPGLSLPAGKGVGFLSFLASNLPGNMTIVWSSYLAFLSFSIYLYTKTLFKRNLHRQVDHAYDISFSLSISLSLFFSIQMLNYDVSIYYISILLAARTIIGLPNPYTLVIGYALSFLFFLTPLIDQIIIAGLVIKPVMILMSTWILYLFYLVRHESIADNSRL